jgi:hypothetical protein
MGTGERAFNVAALARRFTLLAERPALLYPEPEQRAERVLADNTKTPLDVMLIGGADETDRICAAAVAALKQDARRGRSRSCRCYRCCPPTTCSASTTPCRRSGADIARPTRCEPTTCAMHPRA